MAYVLNAAPGQYRVTGQSVALTWSAAPASTYPQVIAVAVMGV